MIWQNAVIALPAPGTNYVVSSLRSLRLNFLDDQKLYKSIYEYKTKAIGAFSLLVKATRISFGFSASDMELFFDRGFHFERSLCIKRLIVHKTRYNKERFTIHEAHRVRHLALL